MVKMAYEFCEIELVRKNDVYKVHKHPRIQLRIEYRK